MTDSQSSTPVVAIAGAGRMGRGIAVACALAGVKAEIFDLKNRDRDELKLLKQQTIDEVRDTIDMLAAVGMVEQSNVEKICSNVSFSDTSALGRCEFVFEAVPETLDAKAAALAAICDCVSPNVIIASTTSTILSNDLLPLVSYGERFLNAHWLNPAFLVPLVELSPATATSAETVAGLKGLLQSMGKVPVVCSASPGYIVPRMQMLAMNEAARMVEEGVASVEDIDKASKYGFGFRFAILGMLEFIDWGGGDILYHAGNYMTQATGEQRYAAPEIVNENMKQGRVGLRTGKGFLDYDNLDVDAYKSQKLAAFVSMLRHLDVMPECSGSSATDTDKRE